MRRVAAVLIATLLGAGLLAPAAEADPGCQNGGALMVWARGSSQSFRAPIANAFVANVRLALGSVPNQDVELGNEDGDFTLEPGEYPAVDVVKWQLPARYFESRELGANGLVNYLNRRAARCTQEAFILGGFSQGADVVGDVVLREGYGSLSAAARKQIAVVAQYGDPSHFSGRGLLSARPRPAYLLRAGRIGSWCDVNDFVCNVVDPWNYPWGNSHGFVYTDRYIPDTSGWIADLSRSKIAELRPLPGPVPQAPATPQPVVARTYPEQQGSRGSDTFADHRNASGRGQRIAPAQWVHVSCKVHDPSIGSVSPDGYWYRIASAPWNDTFYAPANTFMNGDPWGGPFTHNTDFAVPDCRAATAPPIPPTPPGGQPPAQPPAPQTYPETTGGPTNTWTNYGNAGGNQGPTIPSRATVQIACRLTGFRVANGNPWWYRIASSPWNNQYYASADAFYNNGATSGSLAGTPWVDERVPLC